MITVGIVTAKDLETKRSIVWDVDIPAEIFAVKNPFDKILEFEVETAAAIEATNGIILEVHSSALEVTIAVWIAAIIGRTIFTG